MSIASVMNDLVVASNNKYDTEVNRLYKELIDHVRYRAGQGQTSCKYSTSGPFDSAGCLYITGQLRSRLTHDGFVVRDCYSLNGNVLESTFSIKW